MRIAPVLALNAASLASSTPSTAIDAAQWFAASVQVIATGTPTGTVKVQVSNDAPQAGNLPFVPTSWTDLAGATVTVSAAGSFLIPKFDCAYRWIRVVPGTSGTGTVSAQVAGFSY